VWKYLKIEPNPTNQTMYKFGQKHGKVYQKNSLPKIQFMGGKFWHMHKKVDKKVL
jgi:hypothetical protein